MNFIANESAQKLRGGFYTEPDIASFLARWVLEKKPKSVLEPSCGDGAFLEAIVEGKCGSLRKLFGCEMERDEAFLQLKAKLQRGADEAERGELSDRDEAFEELRERIEQLKIPTPDDSRLVQLRTDVEASAQQVEHRRLTLAQDLAWALINSPAFLFNR